MWSVLSAIILWGLAEVAAVPKVYATKDSVKTIAAKIDHGFERLDCKIDRVNEYLRDAAAGNGGN